MGKYADLADKFMLEEGYAKYPSPSVMRGCLNSFADWLDAAQQLAEADAGGPDRQALIALKVLAMLVQRGKVYAEAVNRALEVRGSRYCIFDHDGIWDVGELPASAARAA